MNIVGTLTNPVVLIGGALLGVVLLLNKSGSNNQSVGANPAIINATVSMNTAAMGAQMKMAEINAQLGVAALSYDVQKQVAAMSFLKAQDDNSRMINQQRIISAAGITNNQISSGTALVIDAQQNSNRLNLAYVNGETAKAIERSRVDMVKLQTDAARAISRNNLFGSIVNAVGGVVGAVASGGLSLAGSAAKAGLSAGAEKALAAGVSKEVYI